MSKQKVIIIGAGLGGLVCAALLAKEGLDVTVVEKNQRVWWLFTKLSPRQRYF